MKKLSAGPKQLNDLEYNFHKALEPPFGGFKLIQF